MIQRNINDQWVKFKVRLLQWPKEDQILSQKQLLAQIYCRKGTGDIETCAGNMHWYEILQKEYDDVFSLLEFQKQVFQKNCIVFLSNATCTLERKGKREREREEEDLRWEKREICPAECVLVFFCDFFAASKWNMKNNICPNIREREENATFWENSDYMLAWWSFFSLPLALQCQREEGHL